MKNETTPPCVTDKIIELCNQIVPDVKPQFVPVKEQEWCEPSECFYNVESMVQEQGGKQVNGWAIWQWANILVEAEAHSVWENQDGQLLDITPHSNRETEILFLLDKDMIYNGNTIPNVRLALTASPLVAELIQLMDEKDKIMCATPGRMCNIPQPLMYRIAMIQAQLKEKVRGNEFCPCQSGLKYKKCCGRDE